MAVTYQWRWLRGVSPTQKTKFTIGATALGQAWTPVTLTANLVVCPTAGCELMGVVPKDAGATAEGVVVYVGEDVYEVQIGAGVTLALGDPVQIAADGSVIALAGGYCVGYVVDYTPETAGICHILARPSVLSTSGLDDASLKLPLAGGTLTGDLVMTGGEHITLGEASNVILGTATGTKIGTAAAQKLGFHNATPVIQASGADQAAAPAGGTGATAGAYDTAEHRDAAIALLNEIRTCLVNLGLMKGSA